MARRKRIEFDGALYHVLNRGNYRAPIFRQGRSGAVFEELLFESCEKFHWELHAFTIMSNHYHLALGTPGGDLSTGMQWLQGTFANRFNRYVQTPGHVFQGRFKALLVEPGPSLLRLVNYIHLNPVHAHIIPLEQLNQYRLSSFHWFLKKHRPEFLKCADWLQQAGSFPPTSAGFRAYWKYLELILETDPKRVHALEKSLCQGWYFGSDEGKQGLIEDMTENQDHSEYAKAFDREALTESLLHHALKLLKRTSCDLQEQPKGVYWKCALARHLHQFAGASNTWLSKHLHMGHPAAVSRLKRKTPRTGPDRQLDQKLEQMFKYKA